MTYHPFFMWISSSSNCLKLFSCFAGFFSGDQIMPVLSDRKHHNEDIWDGLYFPSHLWQQLVGIDKKKRLDLKIKNWVQDLHYEKVKIKRTVALIAVLCLCKLMLSVWSFIRHKNIKDGGIFIMLFWSLKTSNMFYSHRKLISNNASFFVAVLQWLHPLVQENENKYASQIKCIGLVFFF